MSVSLRLCLVAGQPQRVLSFINTDPESGTTPTAHLSLVIQDCVYEDPVGTSGTFVYIDNLDALVTVCGEAGGPPCLISRHAPTRLRALPFLVAAV